MGVTYRELLKSWISVRDAKYSSDPGRYEAMMTECWFLLQTILEKLADQEDRQLINED